MLKAVVWTRYGPPDVLELRDVETPVPKNNEVLVKIHATTVSMGDCEMRDLRFTFLFKLVIRLYNGIRRPRRIKILGQEFAGEIASIGKDVTKFKLGDKVFGSTNVEMGSYAEYRCLPEESILTTKPENMSYEEAAAVPLGGINALHFTRKAEIQTGQKVLVNGAGGTIGTFAVQLTKYYGAEVTAIDSGDKLDMLTSIGADYVIDYKKEDFTKRDETYDVIFDIVAKAPFSGSIRALNENGIYLMGNPTLSRTMRGRVTSLSSTKRVIGGSADYNTEDLVFLRELIEDGQIRSVIDRRYPLEQIQEAHRYVESGEKLGNVVITVIADK